MCLYEGSAPGLVAAAVVLSCYVMLCHAMSCYAGLLQQLGLQAASAVVCLSFMAGDYFRGHLQALLLQPQLRVCHLLWVCQPGRKVLYLLISRCSCWALASASECLVCLVCSQS
jgi:hypothetical protein